MRYLVLLLLLAVAACGGESHTPSCLDQVGPAPDGVLNPLVLAAADIAGVDEIYRIGGAQAVAALAYGTETISSVVKITGPGNAYVAEAKRQVFGQVGIDMIAGPSEVLIIANSMDEPGRLADLVASNIELKMQERQAVLQESDVGLRLKMVNEFLSKEVALLEMQQQISSQARGQLDRTQRDFYCRQRFLQLWN